MIKRTQLSTKMQNMSIKQSLLCELYIGSFLFCKDYKLFWGGQCVTLNFFSFQKPFHLDINHNREEKTLANSVSSRL